MLFTVECYYMQLVQIFVANLNRNSIDKWDDLIITFKGGERDMKMGLECIKLEIRNLALT